MEEETINKKQPLELTNESNVITFIISIINDILIYNLEGDKFHDILNIFRKNLPKHPSVFFIETLDYLSKDSEKFHILLFLEFSRKSMDDFFEKIQHNRNILQFFIQQKNVFFINYLQYCIDLFRKFKTVNFIVKSAVLDQYNTFLSNGNKQSSSLTPKMGFSTRVNKRSSTPTPILTILDGKYQWKINTKNLSVSPSSSESRQFFANNNQTHKKKNSSFADKFINKSVNHQNFESNSNSSTKNAEMFLLKIQKVEQQIQKKKIVLKNLKQTNEILKKLTENLHEEIQNLHSDLKIHLKHPNEISDATQQSNDDIEKNLNKQINNLSEMIVIPMQSSEYMINLPHENQDDIRHYKKNSRANKLSFGLKSLSHEKFDSFHNLITVSPKFEGAENNKSFTCVNFHSFVLEGNQDKSKKATSSPSGYVGESDSSNLEEMKPVLKKSQILFKEKYENLCMRGYKAKPLKKISVTYLIVLVNL